MFNRFKTAIYSAVGVEGADANGTIVPNQLKDSSYQNHSSTPKFSKNKKLCYCRPAFLQLNSPDEVYVTADHALRPIICPRPFLPWNAGYAEAINAGKSRYNEDQSTVHLGYLSRSVPRQHKSTIDSDKLPATASDLPSSSDKNESTESVVNENFRESTDDAEKNNGDQEITKTESDVEINGDVTSSNDEQSHAAPSEKLQNGLSSDTPAVGDDSEASVPVASPHFCNVLPNESLFVDEGEGMIGVSVPYYYFAVFDGHAGWGAAVYASKHLQTILHEGLSKVVDYIVPDHNPKHPKVKPVQHPLYLPPPTPDVSSVVVGALEQAFHLMDKKIEQDRHKNSISGGCTACVAVFIMGKLYVANAGDSRATASLNGTYHPMSNDFTPESENYRVRRLGASHPELLGGTFNPIEFLRRPLRREVGTEALCRHPYMAKGWTYKRITEEDLKFPLVGGTGKRSRVMGTIGVTRGFGDHDLKAQVSSILIKPFLTSEPEVIVLDLSSLELTDNDALVLGTDGLWDVTSNEKAVTTLQNSLLRSQHHLPISDPNRHKYRYTSAAQDLVMSARGKLTEHNWRTNENKHATIDDIATFIIPLKPYQQEYFQWRERLWAAIDGSVDLPKAIKSDLKGDKDNSELKSELPITATITEAINNKSFPVENNSSRKSSQTFGLSMSNFFPSPGTTLSAILSSSANKEQSNNDVSVEQPSSSTALDPIPIGDIYVVGSSSKSIDNQSDSKAEQIAGQDESVKSDISKQDDLSISSITDEENITGHIELIDKDGDAESFQHENLLQSDMPEASFESSSTSHNTTNFGSLEENERKDKKVENHDSLNPLMDEDFEQDNSGASEQIPR